ncbi:choice-of-anchor P family protein [Spongiactinospora sp. TRM90649]|uniref:choice-of-anchor P family protein n=1 Tax=Spongiactinospora sp. TRM90649 TaxID=3031114 RepID=UPI0023FA22D1|nr:choice-of-anchor P family protein [Spongiactinospora sp. TRM90649]MDF5757825.1 choice-of-anchor P family protein [Spongiactinospora sp. TRM90649]
MGLSRHVAGAAALGVAVAATLVGAAASASQASTDSPSIAYVLSATGPVAINPVPKAVWPEGQPARRVALQSHENSLITATGLVAAADGTHSEATAADVRTMERHITAQVIKARCEGGRGVTTLTGARLGERAIEANPAPNTTIPVDLGKMGTASVTLNKQVRGADGRLNVTGMAVSLPLAEGQSQTVDVASVACGGAGGTGGSDSSSQHNDGNDHDSNGPGAHGDADDQGRGDHGVRPADVSEVVRRDKVEEAAPAPVPAEVDLPVAG